MTRTSALLEEADALAAGGKIFDAIELLAAARDADAADPSVDALAAELRHRAEQVVDHTVHDADWPPAYPDMFPDTDGVPEIAASELTADVLGSALTHHGSLLVRGLLTEAWADRLRTRIDDALEAYDASQSSAPGDPPLPAYRPLDCDDAELGFTRGFAREQGCVLAADSPPALADFIAAMQSSPGAAAIAGYFGERPALTVKKTTLRRAFPETTPSWHQDGAFLRRLGPVRAVNTWTALSECGVDAPGLEVIGQRVAEVIRPPEGSTDDGRSDSWPGGFVRIKEPGISGMQIVRPTFEPGDAILIDDLTIHQTAVSPTMTKDRYNIEAWFFAPSAFPWMHRFLAF